MAACGVATPVLVVVFLGIGLEPILASWKGIGAGPSAPVPVAESPFHTLRLSLRSGFPSMSYAEDVITGAWLIMTLGGWWRPEKSGLDRLGRAIGATWIGVMMVRFAAAFVG
jgi:hypothetical protein